MGKSFADVPLKLSLTFAFEQTVLALVQSTCAMTTAESLSKLFPSSLCQHAAVQTQHSILAPHISTLTTHSAAGPDVLSAESNDWCSADGRSSFGR